MRKLVVVEFLSLDGVYQGPGAPQEDTEGGFQHGGWQVQYGDEAFGERAIQGLAETDAQLFGRKTYQIMAAYWPKAPADNPFASHLNSVQKYVVSKTLDTVDWEPTTVLRGDLVEDITALKDQPGKNITVLGSGVLVQSLLANGLVDELLLAIYPIVLGGGKRLFAESDRVRKLRLLDSTATSTGGLLATYAPESAC
jgi:dihydrofolate reductase